MIIRAIGSCCGKGLLQAHMAGCALEKAGIKALVESRKAGEEGYLEAYSGQGELIWRGSNKEWRVLVEFLIDHGGE